MRNRILQLAIYGTIGMFLLAMLPMAAGAPAWDIRSAVTNLTNKVDQVLANTEDIKDQLDEMQSNNGNQPVYEYGHVTIEHYYSVQTDPYNTCFIEVPFTLEHEGPFKLTIEVSYYGNSVISGGQVGIDYSLDSIYYHGFKELERGYQLWSESFTVVSTDGSEVDFTVNHYDDSFYDGDVIWLEITYVAEVYTWLA